MKGGKQMADMPKLMNRNVQFGCDPEFFIREIKTKKVITADKLLPSKNKKLKIVQGQAFFDGVQAEMNVNSASCREYLQDNIFYNLKAIQKHINKKGKKYQLWCTSTTRVTQKDLMNADPECRVFGCAPSKNAYGSKKIKLDGSKHLYRYAGGHIHLGYKPKTTKDAEELVKVLDRILGITSILLDNDGAAIRRRKYYGMAGEYRTPAHGIEYRTLSNFWIRAPELTSLMMGLARVAYTIHIEGYNKHILKAVSDKDTKDIIDNSKVIKARTAFNKLKPFLTKVHGPLACREGLAYFEYMARNGLDQFFDRNFDRDWKLSKGSSYHGDTAKGFWRGMYQRLNKSKKYQKFYKAFIKKEGNKYTYNATFNANC